MATAAPLFAVLLFAPALLAQTGDPISQAQKALEANQPAAAEVLLREAAASQPDNYSVHFNLALVLTMQQKDEEAEKEYRRTLELKPGLYESNLNLGMLLLRDQKPEAALPFLKEAAAARPMEFRPAFFYAEALLATGDAAQAEAQYQTAVDADAKSAPSELGLGRALLRQSKLPEALTHVRAAVALDPRDRDVLLDIAAAFEKENRINEAIAIYREFPENTAVQQHLGNLLLASNDFVSAIPHLEAAVKTDPSVANRMALADAYRMNKQTDWALQQLQLAAAADPTDFDLRMTYGKTLRDDHKTGPAAQQFAAAAKLRPDSVKAWNELAALLVLSQDYTGGLAALDHVRALGQESPGDFFYRAISLDRLRRLKPARDAYRQFLASDGGKLPDEEFQARQRIRIIEDELKK